MRNRSRIIFEAKGLQSRLERLAVEPNQSLASIVRAVLLFGLNILEDKQPLNCLNTVIVTGFIALIEIEVRNAQPVTVLLLEFSPSVGVDPQHLQVEVEGVLGTNVFHNYRVGDQVIVKGHFLTTGDIPPRITAYQVVPFKAVKFINLLKEL